MKQRARSDEDKAQRAEDLLAAAEALALELGGVRYVTMAPVTERAGMHRTGVRRYYASKEELLLELAERGWGRWRDAVRTTVGDRTGLGPAAIAQLLTGTITALPVFCDLLTHALLYLEGEVDLERAHRYKTNATAAHDEIAELLSDRGTMTTEQIVGLLATTVVLAAGLWQTAHPSATLAELYEREPRFAHAADEFAPRLGLLLQATANGLAAMPALSTGA